MLTIEVLLFWIYDTRYGFADWMLGANPLNLDMNLHGLSFFSINDVKGQSQIGEYSYIVLTS